jgi:hypothetical protein
MQVKNFGKVPSFFSLTIDLTDCRHHVQNTLISPTKIHPPADGAMQQNNPWADQVLWERQKRDVGIAEDLTRGKIAPIMISTIQWL